MAAETDRWGKEFIIKLGRETDEVISITDENGKPYPVVADFSEGGSIPDVNNIGGEPGLDLDLDNWRPLMLIHKKNRR